MKKIKVHLDELTEATGELGEIIKKVKRNIGKQDYDLDRLMKNVEADFMDMSHKISIVVRLAQSHDK
ncbi:MAG: hypothetical protein GY855_14410 [candidate division Zixibacteria bacterium]|nr:hypothetical protein [candidate division Zixibacteria bacterium]